MFYSQGRFAWGFRALALTCIAWGGLVVGGPSGGWCFLACCVCCGRQKLQSIPLSQWGTQRGRAGSTTPHARAQARRVCSIRPRLWLACCGDITHHTCTHKLAVMHCPVAAAHRPGMHNLPVGRVTAWRVSFCAVALASNLRHTARPTCEVCCAARLCALGVCVCVLVVGL